ncbi:hypothetical protein [Flavobacterium sp. Root186]|uniref:hypothetical protein n=1 Tax=Flavobacterium sp. Root186 TaxID=1736485 RepID=UPI000FF877B9|nr:hypothetical protein [Flavobacterium sp. Root186]
MRQMQARLKNIIPTVEQIIKNSNYSSQMLSVIFIKENPTVLNDPNSFFVCDLDGVELEPIVRRFKDFKYCLIL